MVVAQLDHDNICHVNADKWRGGGGGPGEEEGGGVNPHPHPPKHLFSQSKKRKNHSCIYALIGPATSCLVILLWLQWGAALILQRLDQMDSTDVQHDCEHCWKLKHRWPNFHPAERKKLIFQLFQGGVNRHHSSNKHIGF